MRRNQLPPHKGATYVLPRWKVVYVSVSKAACTSIKWLLAELQGEDPERFYRAVNREVTRSLTIHRRRLWQHTPMLHELSDDELAEISPERGWFVFTLVRHPSPRLWSAWQSKLLLRDPRWAAKFGREPWFPRIPSTTEDVIVDFRRFVDAAAAGEADMALRDRHFRPQSQLAEPERVPYTRLYDIGEMPAALDDLAVHLHSRGWEGSLRLRSSNEAPLRPLKAVFTPHIIAAIATIYREDFERLAYDDPMPTDVDPAPRYEEAAFREVARLIERHERIGDLARIAQRLERATQTKAARVRRQTGQLERIGRLDGAVVRHVRRRLLGALRRASQPPWTRSARQASRGRESS